MPIPALIAAGASLAGGLLSNMAASNAQSRSIAAQRSLQNMLMTGGAQMARNAKQAGLSPAFSIGQSSTPAASSPASNYANYDFSSMQNLLGGINQRRLQKQQERVAAEQEKQVREDARLTSENADIAHEKAEQERINTQDLRMKVASFKDYSGEVVNGEPVVSQYRGYNGEYGAALGELERQRIDTEKSSYKLKILQNDWDSKVYRGRNFREDILNAVVEMPKLERDELVERINNFREDVELKRTQEALNGCMSIYYMLAGSLSSAQTEGVQQDTKEKKAGSANETIENFSWKQLGKYMMVHGPELVRAIGAFH